MALFGLSWGEKLRFTEPEKLPEVGEVHYYLLGFTGIPVSTEVVGVRSGPSILVRVVAYNKFTDRMEARPEFWDLTRRKTGDGVKEVSEEEFELAIEKIRKGEAEWQTFKRPRSL